ncbi:MAG: hypothetical protein HKN70_08725, partial [Gammaproteobacteria bacterium]|nr:hypothetical protein [Gammaproteobacteria bacterium]
IRHELHLANGKIQQMELGLEDARRQHREEREKRRQWQNRHQQLESELTTGSTAPVADDTQHQDRNSENQHSAQLASLHCEKNKLARALKRAQRELRKQTHERAPHRNSQLYRADDGKQSTLPANGAPRPLSYKTSSGPSPKLAAMLSTATHERDNLQKIRGIGPVMARTLNELGIYRFEQLAALGTEDITWIASNINTFPGRIERDQWVVQAAMLEREKDGA